MIKLNHYSRYIYCFYIIKGRSKSKLYLAGFTVSSGNKPTINCLSSLDPALGPNTTPNSQLYIASCVPDFSYMPQAAYDRLCEPI